MRRIAVFIGTRPEAIKMAPVVAALERSPAFPAAGGQHGPAPRVDRAGDRSIRHPRRSRSGRDGAEPVARAADGPAAGTHRRCACRSAARHGARARRHVHGAGDRAGSVLSPNTVRPRGGRLADRQPALAVSGRGQPHANDAAHDAPLRPHGGRSRQPPPRTHRRNADRRHRQHGHRRAVHGARSGSVSPTCSSS